MGLRNVTTSPKGTDAHTMSLTRNLGSGFAAPQTASADIEDITSKQTEKERRYTMSELVVLH